MANDANRIQDGAPPDRRRPRRCRRLQSGPRARPTNRTGARPAGASRTSRCRRSPRASTTRCRSKRTSSRRSTASAAGSSGPRRTGVIDTATGQPITDFSKPTKTVRHRPPEGRVQRLDLLDGRRLRRHARARRRHERSGVTSSTCCKNFDFVFDHIDFFRRQAAEFGPQPYGYRRLVNMRELDDCGAIGAALIKAFRKKADPALPAGHRPRRRLHLQQDEPAARPHARAASTAVADGLGRRRLHEHPVPRADGRSDRRSEVLRRRARIR